MTNPGGPARTRRAEARKSDGSSLTPEVRALLDHIAEELAAEYLRLMGTDGPGVAGGNPDQAKGRPK